MPAVPVTIQTFLAQTTQANMRSTGLGIPLTSIAWTAWTLAGAFTCTLTLSANTSVTLPTSGTLATLAGVESLTNKTVTSAALTTCTIGSAGVSFTGSGSGTTVLVAAASAGGTIILPAVSGTLATLAGTETFSNKTFVAPVLGAATCTSINALSITGASGSLVFSGAVTVTMPGNTTTFVTTGTTTATLPSGTSTLYGTGSGTITSLQLKTSLTDETGSGAAVFANTPTLVTPNIGAATGTSLALSGDISGSALVLAAGLDCTTIQCDSVSSGGLVTGLLRPAITLYASDGAISLTSGTHHITKSSAAALSVAAPSSQDGERLVIQSGSDFAHVITFTGSTLRDGTTGAHVTATFAAFTGACLTVVARGSLWYTESVNAVTIT